MKKLLSILFVLALLCAAPAALALDVPATESEIPALPASFTEAAEKYEVPIADLFKSLEPGEDMEYRVVLSRKPELPGDATVEVYLEVPAQGGAYRPASDSVTDNGWELVYQTNSAYATDELGVFIRYTFPSVAADGKTLEAIDQYTCDQAGALRTHEVYLSNRAVSPAYVMDYYYDADNRLTAYEEGTRGDLYTAYYKGGALQYFDVSCDVTTGENSFATLNLSFAPDGLPFNKNSAGRKVAPVTDDAGNEIGKLIVHFDDYGNINNFTYFVRNDEPEVVYWSIQNSWRKYDLANGVQTEGVTPAGAPDSQFINAVKPPLVMGTLPADAAEVSLPASLQSVIDQYAFPEDIVKSVDDIGGNQYRVHFSKMIQQSIEESTDTSYLMITVGQPTLYLNGQENWLYENPNDFVEEEGGCYFDIPLADYFVADMDNYSSQGLEFTVELPLWCVSESYTGAIDVTINDVFSADGRRILRSVVNGDTGYQDIDGKLVLTSYSDGNLTGSYNPETGKLESVSLSAEFYKEKETFAGRLILTRFADGTDARFETNDSAGNFTVLHWDSEQKAWMTDSGAPYAGELPEDMPANPEEIDLGVTF